MCRLRRSAALTLLALTVSLSGCAKPGPQTYVIGFANPLTAGSADLGRLAQLGVMLRVKELNESGGIGGRQLEVLYNDDKSDPKEAANIAQLLASTPEVIAVIGHFNSSCTIAGKAVYAQAHLVEFSCASTNPTVCDGTDYTFRNIYRDDYQGSQDAHYVKEILKKQKVAVMFDNDDYGRGLKDAFSAEAKKIGLTIVAEEAYTRETSKDFDASLTKLKGLAPEVIFIAGLYTEVALIIKQARDLGVAAQFMGADGAQSMQLIALAKDAAEGFVLSGPMIPDTNDPVAKKFLNDMRTVNHREGDAWSGLGYDAAGIMADAIAKGAQPPTRESIRNYIQGINSREKAFHGVTGPTWFDANGDCLKPMTYLKVEHGQFVPATQLGS